MNLNKKATVIISILFLNLIACTANKGMNESSLNSFLKTVSKAQKLISTDGIEYGGSMSTKYGEIYHVVNDEKWTGSYSVVRKFENGQFTKSDTVRFAGKTMQGGDVHLSHDGSEIFFTSRVNPDPKNLIGNIWMAKREAQGWSKARKLPATVNSTNMGEYSPSLSKSGNLYFTRFSEARSGDIYVSKFVDGAFQEAKALVGKVNSDSLEADSWVSPDEDFILFVRKSGKDGFGVTDMFISFNNNGEWTEAKNLGKEYNSKGVDGSPIVTPDGKHLVFTSNRESSDPKKFDGKLDIYIMPFDLAEIKKRLN